MRQPTWDGVRRSIAEARGEVPPPWAAQLLSDVRALLRIAKGPKVGRDGTVWLPVAEVARRLRWSERMVRDALRAGRLRGYRVNGRWRVKADHVDELMGAA